MRTLIPALLGAALALLVATLLADVYAGALTGDGPLLQGWLAVGFHAAGFALALAVGAFLAKWGQS